MHRDGGEVQRSLDDRKVLREESSGGIVDKVISRKLKDCVIGMTKKTLSPTKLFELLEEKGWIDFEVQQVAGNQFLLVFDREEMASTCLDWDWEWLPEIFSDFCQWHKDYTPENRVTWVAILGVPLHAWNNYTFNNILNRWGEILYIEDEHLVGNDFSIKRAKLLTNHLELIEESIDLNCDGDIFKVRLREFSFAFWSSFELPCDKYEDPPWGYTPASGYDFEENYSKTASTFVEESYVHLQKNSGVEVTDPGGDFASVQVAPATVAQRDVILSYLETPFSNVVEADMEMVRNNMEGPSWAQSVDLLNNPLSAKDVVAVRNCIVDSEEESFFPELVKSIGKKKYATLLDLQDEVLSIKEKNEERSSYQEE
ncbi:hypothetical protein V6N12_041986 [Hibiscus sabdariffa]|uniref:DUF4283 domain-containing protein n=1 Tax=Hibiscus sabdariffa TaxID=183260 RepID=A0ABR2EFQ0_9ROSI